MIIRNLLLSILVLTLLAFCGFLAVEVIRIEADVRQAASNVTTVAVKIDTGVDKVGASVTAGVAKVVDHVDKAVGQVDASLGTAVGNLANPLPALPKKPPVPLPFKLP